VDRVHEPKATSDEASCKDESGYSSGERYKQMWHADFPRLRPIAALQYET